MDLLLVLLPTAGAAALGEELLLRGVLQKKLLRHLNGQAAVWLAALVFGVMHFEFAGVLPRILLGAVLGYAYYWTGSLWVPILLHALFNGIQVVNTYVTGKFEPDTAAVAAPNLALVAASLLAVLALGFFLNRQSYTRINHHPTGDTGEETG
ncbi:MAG: CPBP family intramembrane metalloprotease [Lewinella sp.]|nr:CPBP family intramembrane metalloprotease [Lewinella sp.]